MGSTSPYSFSRSSFFRTTYLPKIEANFLKDFNCCGLKMDSLHELLQHYEECHQKLSAMTQTPLVSDNTGFTWTNPRSQLLINNNLMKCQISEMEDVITLEDMEISDHEIVMGDAPQPLQFGPRNWHSQPCINATVSPVDTSTPSANQRTPDPSAPGLFGGMSPGEANKPFNCPAIGCGNTYWLRSSLEHHKKASTWLLVT